MVKSRRPGRILVVVSFLAVLACPIDSQAGPITPYSTGGFYQYNAIADRSGSSSGIQVLNSDTSNLQWPNVDLTVNGTEGSVSNVKMSGSAAVGADNEWALKAYAEATASSTSVYGAEGVVQMELGFIDTLFINSSTLAVGTPVQFEYVSVLHSLLSFSGTQNCAEFGNAYVDMLIGSSAERVGKSNCDTSAPATQTLTLLFNAAVGDEVGMLSRMRVILSAAAGQGGDTFQHATVDASNTGTFYINMLTPGASISSASGALYAAPSTPTPVPEPASLTLLGVGGVVAGLARRRRRTP